MIIDLLVFYGEGDAVFGHFATRYLAAAREARTSLLQEIMTRHGSDKGTWHSYPLFYELLLELLPGPPGAIFEVGIGSNNPTLPGNMGANGVPGASHRAWREFFPEALIYGADYDTACLFDEPCIKTFYLDQYDIGSIHRAWSVMPHLFFDVIVDDGAHTWEANTALLDACFARLRPGGLYIIEDIILELPNISRFDEYFRSRGWDAFLMRLPHSGNMTDNAVAVVRRPISEPGIQNLISSSIEDVC